MICRKKYLNRQGRVLSDDAVFKIFRIFCLLAELTPDKDKESYQVLLHTSEATYIARALADSLGCHWDEDDFNSLCSSIGAFRLLPFITVLESKCLNGLEDNAAIEEAISDIYQTYVEDVIKKGFLAKKGYIFPTMREYWFVLRPSELTYYKTRSEKDKCGCMAIENGSRVEAKAGYRIALHTPERTYEFESGDHMTRLQWIAAFQLAVDHSSGSQSFQRLQAGKRKIQRQKKAQDMLKAKALLQLERTARQAAEG